jgi:hypothetical protein
LGSSRIFDKAEGMADLPKTDQDPPMIPDEHEHAHAHKTGIPWLDLIIAGSAILISVVSLMVSIHHGKVMESLVDANTKMVEASTLPILDFGVSNADATGKSVITFTLANQGVGPAIVEWTDLRWRGKPITNMPAFMTECCGTPNGWFTQNADGATLPAGREINMLTVPLTDLNRTMWGKLDQEGRHITARACYCSVLDECWVTNFGAERPQKVTTCAAAKAGDLSPPEKKGH